MSMATCTCVPQLYCTVCYWVTGVRHTHRSSLKVNSMQPQCSCSVSLISLFIFASSKVWAHSCVFLSLCQSFLRLLTWHFHCGLFSCQWMGDRVMASQSTPSSLYSSPSPSSDWSARRRERSSPLRGPHGKFVSPSSVCGYASSSSSPLDQNTPQRSRGERHTDMAELAKHVSLSLEAWLDSFKNYIWMFDYYWSDFAEYIPCVQLAVPSFKYAILNCFLCF